MSAPREHRIEVTRTARYWTLGAEDAPTEVWFVLHGYRQLAERFLRRFVPLDDGSRLVVAPEGLSEETARLAGVVAGKLGAAVKIGKRAFYEQADLGLAEAYAHAAGVMVENMLWRDTDEGISAFIEKRRPDWA